MKRGTKVRARVKTDGTWVEGEIRRTLSSHDGRQLYEIIEYTPGIKPGYRRWTARADRIVPICAIELLGRIVEEA
jgi:hypothetical protein